MVMTPSVSVKQWRSDRDGGMLATSWGCFSEFLCPEPKFILGGGLGGECDDRRSKVSRYIVAGEDVSGVLVERYCDGGVLEDNESS